MSRQKKSRKPGSIGSKKSTQKLINAKKPKKKTGLASGSRHNLEQNTSSSTSKEKKRQDTRVGSKKPIVLVEQKVPVEQKKPMAKLKKANVTKTEDVSPEQELALLENDQRLNQLLDKSEAGKRLSKEEQTFLDSKLTRYQALCDLLGIETEEEEEDGDWQALGNEWQEMLDEDNK